MAARSSPAAAQGAEAPDGQALREVTQPALGFARRFRLRKRQHFLRTQRRGQRIAAGNVVVFMAQHRLPHSRFGFTVSKVGKAVVGNKVRRRLKEIIRQNQRFRNATAS